MRPSSPLPRWLLPSHARRRGGACGRRRWRPRPSAEVTKAQAEGKCTEASIGEIKMPKYASWGDYERHLAGNVERYCTFHATEK